jgi:DUF1680 family protein
VRLVLPMPVELIESHPHVTGNRGRVALQRGPLVYCVEQADNPGADAWDLALPEDPEFSLDKIQIGDQQVVGLRTAGVAATLREWQNLLYSPYAGSDAAEIRTGPITAIPYYAWANREAGPMQVWIPVAAKP